MPDPIQTTGPRPGGAPQYEAVVRLGVPPSSATAARPNHPVLLPDADAEDEVPMAAPAARSAVTPHWYQRLAKPAAYIASALGGAVLVTLVYGMLGSGTDASGNRSGSDAVLGSALLATDTAVLDRRADTLALAISAFTLRASMYDSRRMACSGLARGLQQVEDGWVAYNIARKEMLAASDGARDARDRALYADVRAVELRFERSSCARP